jgi:hypothetical protein
VTVSPSIQIAVDCADPHALATFWGAALAMTVERDPEQIQAIIDAGYATVEDTVEVDGVLSWATAAAIRDETGRLPRMIFQQVPEPKQVKNRWHIDVNVGEADRASEVERLLVIGATWLWDGQQGPHTWVTLADPEGNEFCVT